MSTFCAMGEKCKAYDSITRTAALSVPHYLCLACRTDYERTVKLLVYDYIDLSQITARRFVVPDDKLARPKPSSTPPIDLAVDALRTDIVWTVGTWEVVVRDAAGLPARDYVNGRDGFQVDAGCRVIAPRVDVLAGIGEVKALHDGRDGEPTEVTGAQGLWRLSELHRRARAITGLCVPTFRLPGECPSCGAAGAQRRVSGEETVWCALCRKQWTHEDYLDRIRLVSLDEVSPSPEP